jgi:hypothetical protein
MSALRCDSNKNHDLGTSAIKWGTAHLGDLQAETGTFSSNLTVEGNLTVTGTQTSLQVSTVEAEDPLIKLARGNSGDTLDIGFYGLSNDGSDKYHGLFRDQDDSGKFKLFKDLASEPSTTVGTLATGNKATLVAHLEGDVTGALTGNADTASAFATARTVTFSGGDVAGAFSIDGSADVSSVALTIQSVSVENSMLAGSIANDKLSNSAITVTAGDALTGGGSVSLGGTVSLAVGVDDSSIEVSSDALRVKALGVSNAMLAGSIADSKLSTISTTDKVSGSAVQLASTSAIENSSGLRIKAATAGAGLAIADQVLSVGVDDASIEINSDALRVKAGGISNDMLGGNIANGKLANSTISFGGVQLSLGGSDANPAFDLSDATAYRTSALDGTISNAQLAGSIANAKLSNSGITIGDGSNSEEIALGGEFEIKGTSNEVEVTYSTSNNDFTIGLPSTITAALNGNASTANALNSAVSIGITGGPVRAANISFDGSGAVALQSTIADDQITNDMLANPSLGFGDGGTPANHELGKTVVIQGTSNEVDCSVSHSATGPVFTIGLPNTIQNDTSGNAATATALASARSIGITAGPVRAANISFDGSGNVAMTSSIADEQITNDMLASDSITFAGGSGSQALQLGDTFTINGTSNEIETAVSGDAITIGLPNSVNVTSNLDVGGNLTLSGAAIITGNITASGQLSASGANISFADTLIEFGVNNTSAKDHGFYSQRSSGAFCGFVFDESDDKFKVFTTDTEPSTTVDTSQGGFSKGDFEANTIAAASTLSGAMRMTGSAPASVSATGTAGDLRFDSSKLYVCISENTWKAVDLSSF